MEPASGVDEMQKWVTFAGAVIAAGASSFNLWRQYSEKADKIKVVFGPLQPQTEPGYWLYVVSLRDHKIVLKDYGFIDESGKLLSLPQLRSDEPCDTKLVFSGTSSFDQRGDLFEVGVGSLRDNQIGAFAVTAGKKHYALGFRHDVPLYRRLWIRLRIRLKPGYQ